MAWIGSAPNQTTQRTDGTRTGASVFADQKTAGIKIRADLLDVHAQDIVDMIDDCLKKDGGNFTATVDAHGNIFDNVGNASARDHFAAAGQVQDASLIYAATSSNDTITASLTPAITAYATGALFVAKIGGTNTGAATINYNSVGAKNIRKGKTGSLAVSAGDLAAGRMALFAYDGTNMQLLNAPEFPSGTVMLFNQTAAPTGWTKNTSTGDDTALRLTTGTVGTGGTVAFQTAFASRAVAGTVGNTTLSTAQIPSHQHLLVAAIQTTGTLTNGNQIVRTVDTGSNSTNYLLNGTSTEATIGLSSSVGGGGSHNHTFTGTAIDLDVAFVDVIRATKD